MLDAVVERKELIETELARIVPVLIEHFDPQLIVAYGSIATGGVNEWSDIDLLIVQESDVPFWHRPAKICALLDSRVNIDIFAYTPEEFERVRRRDPFVRDEMLAKGRVLYQRDGTPEDIAPVPLSPEEEKLYLEVNAESWLKRARDDLKMASFGLEGKVYPQACFHSQQVVEKTFKALVGRQQYFAPPRAHMQKDLLALLPPEWFGDLREEIRTLDYYYIPTRYPTAEPGLLPYGEPSQEQAESAVNTARTILERTERLLRDWK